LATSPDRGLSHAGWKPACCSTQRYLFRQRIAAVSNLLAIRGSITHYEIPMIRANCRARFTAADFDFIVRTLARSQSDQVSLVDLLSDVDTRDSFSIIRDSSMRF